MKRAYFQWLLMAIASATGLFWAWHYGLISQIYSHDISKLTVVTALLYAVSTLWIGWLSYKFNEDNWDEVEHDLEIGWFLSDMAMNLGLAGTIIGFIFMMSTQLTGIDASNAANMANVLGNISQSLGTAFYTTIVGITASMCIKFQAFNLQFYIERLKKDVY